MQEMQEQFPEIYMDVKYARNAGTISRDLHGSYSMQEQFFVLFKSFYL